MINSLKSIQQELEKGVLIKDIKLSNIQKEAIKDTFFISKLPISIVINSSDDNSDLLNGTLNIIEKSLNPKPTTRNPDTTDGRRTDGREIKGSEH